MLALASRNPDVLCSCCRQLSRVLESRDLKVAVVAADYLARIHALPGVSGQGSATAWAVVEQGLRAPDLETRRRARTALTFSLGPRDACVAVLLGQSDDIALRSERREIGQALGTIAVDYAAAWPDSHAPVVDPDLLLGFLIGVARSDASRLGPQRVDWLLGHVSAGDADVRLAAVRALAAVLPNARVELELTSLEDDPDERIRRLVRAHVTDPLRIGVPPGPPTIPPK